MQVPAAITGLGDDLLQNQTRGFVAGLDAPQVYIIDLTASPPTIAAGTNPLTVSHNALDMALSTDGQFLFVAGGGATPYPISVVALSSLSEVSTFSTGSYANAIETCDDGSVLVTAPDSLVRFSVDAAGAAVETGRQPFAGYAINVYCGPGSKAAFVIDGLGAVQSFTLPTLVPVAATPLSNPSGQSAAISPAGDRLFVRSDPFRSTGAIDAIAIAPKTGAMGASLLFSSPIQGQWQVNGTEQIAISGDGAKLFVSQPSGVIIHDATTGAAQSTIQDASIVAPGGVAVAHPPGPVLPTSTEQCKEDGCMQFGFRNQGECIAYVNTGKLKVE